MLSYISPSFSNIEMSRNLDMQELDYNPSKKDLTDAKIHHLLAEELKPYKRVSASNFRLVFVVFFKYIYLPNKRFLLIQCNWRLAKPDFRHENTFNLN